MNNDEFHALIPIKIVTKSISDNEDNPWIFEGIASTSDLDLVGEVVYPESFKSSVEFFKTNGKIYFDHSYAFPDKDNWLEQYGLSKEDIVSLKLPIGHPLDAKITDEGLYIKAVLNKRHPIARLIWNNNLTQKGFENELGLSIGAKHMGVARREYDYTRGKYVTYLPDLLLYEVSVTNKPVNPNTRTWAYAMKSMLTNDTNQDSIQYHTIEPEEVIYDTERGLVIKSIVQGGDDVVHVFESYISKEDMKKAMDKKDVKKALPGEVPGEPEDPAAQLGGDPAGAVDAPAGDIGGLDDAGAEDAVDPGESTGDSGILDSLLEDSNAGVDEEGADLGLDEEEDAGQQVMLDKMDTILDALMQLIDKLGGETAEAGELPAGDQVSNIAPTVVKSISEKLDAMKNVSLSPESLKNFSATMKATLDEYEDRLVERIADRLANETTFTTKSVADDEIIQIVQPGIAVSSDTAAGDDVPEAVMKSINVDDNEEELDKTALKAFVNNYVSVRGADQGAIQKRALIAVEAREKLNITSGQFNNYVRQMTKGNKF